MKTSIMCFVQILFMCLMGNQSALGSDEHDHDHDFDLSKIPARQDAPPQIGGSAPTPSANESASAPLHTRHEDRDRNNQDPGRVSGGGCRVVPDSLAAFANNERYDLSSMVTFLTDTNCGHFASQISQVAMGGGIKFETSGPYRLDHFANSLSKNSLDAFKRVDVQLGNMIPGLMEANPMSSDDAMKRLGAWAVLSPSAGRYMLAKIAQQELISGDDLLTQAGTKGRKAAAIDLAVTMLRLGANEPVIASEMAEAVQSLAISERADSLTKFFRSLAAVSSVEASLVPTFNLTAGAFNRGIQLGAQQGILSKGYGLVKAVFESIKAAVSSSPSLEPGASELNQAFASIHSVNPMDSALLKMMWQEALAILSATSSQSALAQAISANMVPDTILLFKQDRQALLAASNNYPVVAGAVQKTFLTAWSRSWNDVNEGNISPAKFNDIKNNYMKPLVGDILNLDPSLVDPHWLAAVLEKQLVSDKDIEQRFPKHVLTYLNQSERAAKVATIESSVKPTVGALAQNFGILWALSQVHMPALNDWVGRYEK